MSALANHLAAYGGAGLSPFASPNLLLNSAQDRRNDVANGQGIVRAGAFLHIEGLAFHV